MEREVYDEVTNFKDGLNHLKTTRPASEETGGNSPTHQPKMRLVKEGEKEPSAVVYATNPSWVETDSALAEPTVS